MSILNEKMKVDAVDKLARALIHKDPHPERFLRMILRDISEKFAPRNIDQSEIFLKEFIRAAAFYCAVDNSTHIHEHPDEAKVCVPRGTEEMGRLFAALAKDSTIFLCKHEGLENPWEVPSTNEKLKEELLQEINNDN